MFRVFFAAALAATLALPVAAVAETTDVAPACGKAYHDKLTGIAAVRGDKLASVFASVRAADPALPGRWMFVHDAKPDKSGRIRTAPVTSEVCVAWEGRGKRARCTNSETRVLGSTEIAFTSVKDQADVQAMRALGDFVARRGAVPEVGDNGRLTWLVQKLAQDLKSYVTQPPHPAMCAGGREVSEFYGAQATPLDRRRQDIRSLLDSVQARARERARVFVTLPATGPRDKMQETVAQTAIPVAAQAMAGAVTIAEAATARDLIAMVLAPVLSAEQTGEVADETTVFAAMRRAKTFLLERQDAAATGASAAGVVSETVRAEREALGRALVAIEMLAYAELLHARFDTIGQSILATPGEILRAHTAACNCPE